MRVDKPKFKSYSFSSTSIETLGEEAEEFNWPVVYQIYDDNCLYVGETTNLRSRMLQHLQSPEKNLLTNFTAIFDDTFNKSVALDLESQLIQWYSGEGYYKMLNKNEGLVDHNYFDRARYRTQFEIIWDHLRKNGLATDSVKEIENSNLFKFSPYKRLSKTQIEAVYNVLLDIEEAFTHNKQSISIIGGSEGTGKTIVIMYLAKLLRDIQDYRTDSDDIDLTDGSFGLFFTEPFRSRFDSKSIALVVPSPSLKGSIAKIFKGITNMQNSIDVLSPIEFGSNGKFYDITLADEAHLLKASNLEVHKSNRERVNAINKDLFNDNETHTELDWIVAKSKSVVMVYGDQRIRQNSITKEDVNQLQVREHILKSQMRSRGGELYIDYLRAIFASSNIPEKQMFPDFEFKLFTDFRSFVEAIKQKEQAVGLSRFVAGFAWKWQSNSNRLVDDIVIDGIGFKWNSKLSDWVGSPKSINEVGSIYTIQGYDLNYCGVIIGNDIRYDPIKKQIYIDKKYFFDIGAKIRSKQQIDAGIKLTDEELLDQVIRTYRILMNRSIMGTYLYVCDDNLREYLAHYTEVDSNK